MVQSMKEPLRKRLNRFRLNDNGTALISIIAVAIFLSVIATTVIYISGKNYQIKANDYQNKNTFYQAEMALDEFKGALAADVSEAFKFAYGETMPDFAALNSGDKRNEKYKKKYFDYLCYKWTGATKYDTDIPNGVVTHVTVTGDSIYKTVAKFAEESGLENFQKYFIAEENLAAEDKNMCLELYEKKYVFETEIEEEKLIPERFVIKNIRVSCTEKGYSSYICTDIAMAAPSYYMGTTSPPEDTVEKLYMGDYILYMNWHKY